jgi:stearoyl-CoA desaturase (delta-9 desaturase)
MSGEGTALMWVATHRQHHQFSDQPGDPHSPRNGFWWSHCLWFIPTGTDRSRPGYYARYAPDLLRDPFIRFLDRTFVYWHLLLALILFAAGGWSWLVWGVFVRMTFTLNTTWMINSVTHWVGYRNYDTDDDSTNSLWLVPLTFGESLHNNHHAYPSSANNSHRWFELDPSYWTLCLLRRLGLVWSLKGFRA